VHIPQVHSVSAGALCDTRDPHKTFKEVLFPFTAIHFNIAGDIEFTSEAGQYWNWYDFNIKKIKSAHQQFIPWAGFPQDSTVWTNAELQHRLPTDFYYQSIISGGMIMTFHLNDLTVTQPGIKQPYTVRGAMRG